MLLQPIANAITLFLVAEGLYIGSAVAILALAAIAFAIGYRIALQQQRTQVVESASNERQEVLQLIQELGSATQEYSGQVSKYQDAINALSQIVNETPAGQTTTNGQIIGLLEQFVQDNSQLKERLDAAERQLEQKSRQIEGYVTEARTDSMTGLLNRRAFDQKLEEMFFNYRRGGRSFVVSLFDVDHFKSVNDSHGHQVGDQALQAIAGMLAQQLPDALIVARFGGEEFAVITDGPLTKAAARMDALRKTLDQRGVNLESVKLHATVSVGMSEPTDDLAAGSLLRRADEALYAAKNFGRNRVYYHDGRSPTLVSSPETAQS